MMNNCPPCRVRRPILAMLSDLGQCKRGQIRSRDGGFRQAMGRANGMGARRPQHPDHRPHSTGNLWLAYELAQYPCWRGNSSIYQRVRRLQEELRIRQVF